MIKKVLKDIETDVTKRLQKEIAFQRHNMTGRLSRSFETKKRLAFSSAEIDFYFEYYGRFINQGVRPSQIKYPFAGARIAGLKRFVLAKITRDSKKALSIAYAIAAKHKKEGLPTKASRRLAPRRLGWVNHVLDDPATSKSIDAIITQGVEAEIETTFKNFVKRR